LCDGGDAIFGFFSAKPPSRSAIWKFGKCGACDAVPMTVLEKSENPPNASTATGSAFVTVETVALTIDFNVVFSGLTTGDTAPRIHCCVAQGQYRCGYCGTGFAWFSAGCNQWKLYQPTV
jgi:hypothetical protein